LKFGRLATSAALLAALSAEAPIAFADEIAGCAILVGASSASTSPGGFQMRDGEPVDLVSGAKVVHGKLLMFSDGPVFHAYWQPDHSPEKYVLANAGVNTVRLVSTPPQGTPAANGAPGTAVPPQRVLSCPAL
jgi:hypothetical protein